jgi:hypothetical protein
MREGFFYIDNRLLLSKIYLISQHKNENRLERRPFEKDP